MRELSKKEYKIPELNVVSISIEDILLVSTGDTRDIFDFDDEL